MKAGFIILFPLVFFSQCLVAQSVTDAVRNKYLNIKFSYDKVLGIGHEKGVTRRDPSDVIKVGNTFYVYYTKVFGRAPGYWGTIWYAISDDEGFTWKEQGEILGVGADNAFDAQATFTPNILYANNKYYLYYTGVKPTPGNENGAFENNSTTDITAIGLAIADAPDGPFTRYDDDPVLTVSIEPEKFDSYRVDDASLLYRNGLYWLYYKGRSRMHGTSGPRFTQMGAAFSTHPAGPFIKYDKPLLSGSHEVMIWSEGSGVAAITALAGTMEYASDGIDFERDKLSLKLKDLPFAPGAYRPDLVNPVAAGDGLSWGIGMVHNGDEAYLIRFEIVKK